MSKAKRTTALFFTIALLYISVYSENYSRLITSVIQDSQCQNLSPYFGLENSILYFPNRQGENILASIKKLPVSNLNNNSNDPYIICSPPEVIKLNTGSEYLFNSETIYRNLTNCDIVFPFHHFW
jgi:hypothetical protein